MYHRICATITLTVCLFALSTVAAAQIPGLPNINPASSGSDLVSNLTQKLNITPKQAMGGAGAIFGLAKSRLNPADFGKIAGAVPGMDGLLKAAPAGKSGSPLESFGSIAPTGIGGLASLAGSFKSLGLSPDMATKFVPVIRNYLRSKGGASVASLFTGALK